LRALASASDTHNTIVANLIFQLASHLRASGLPCRVVSAPGIQPHVRADWNFRIPDLGVTCQPNRAGAIMTPEPILLIEVLSPGNASDTYENVRAYTTIPSVREIVVVHSNEMLAELYVRNEQGHWPANATEIGSDDPLNLASTNISFSLRAIYEGTYLEAGPRANS
jgi:Uma2 family endonuclease